MTIGFLFSKKYRGCTQKSNKLIHFSSLQIACFCCIIKCKFVFTVKKCKNKRKNDRKR